MEEMGQEPDPEKMPLGYDDIDLDNQISFAIYTKLGNRVYGDVGFTGKDYTNLPILIEEYHIIRRLVLLEKLSIIDDFYVKKSQKEIKKIHDDIKKKK